MDLLKTQYGKVENLFGIRDKVVLITGAGGLAEMFAEGFGSNGAKIVIASQTVAKAEKLCEKLTEANITCMALPLHIEDKVEVEKVVNLILEKFGSLDICLHTAALCVRHNTLEDNEDLFRKHIDVNVIGSLNINRIVGKAMAKVKHGRIINVNTMSSYTVNTPDGFSYGVTKAALAQMTKWFGVTFAKEGVTVNGIAPIWIDTPMMACRSEDYWKHCIEQVPMGRVAVPEDYLGIALYMASEAGRFMTGQTIFVDGGWQINRTFLFDQDKGAGENE